MPTTHQTARLARADTLMKTLRGAGEALEIQEDGRVGRPTRPESRAALRTLRSLADGLLTPGIRAWCRRHVGVLSDEWAYALRPVAHISRWIEMPPAALQDALTGRQEALTTTHTLAVHLYLAWITRRKSTAEITAADADKARKLAARGLAAVKRAKLVILTWMLVGT